MSALTDCGCARCLEAQKRLEPTFTRAEVEALLVAQREACAKAVEATRYDNFDVLAWSVRATPLVEVKP